MSGPIPSSGDPRWPGARARIVAAATGGTVIWDFDGVVADTEPIHAESYRRLLDRRGYSTDDDFFLPLIGHPEREIWGMLRDGGAPVDADLDALVEERRETFLALAIESLQPSWLVVDLAEVFEKATVRQTVVSNGEPETIRALTVAWHLDGLLHTSADQAPATSSKRERLEQLWTSGPTITIEDNGGYLALASAAGSFCVAVSHGMSPAEPLSGDVEVRI